MHNDDDDLQDQEEEILDNERNPIIFFPVQFGASADDFVLLPLRHDVWLGN